MDPQVAYSLSISQLKEGDIVSFLATIRDLADWIKQGGFFPTDDPDFPIYDLLAGTYHYCVHYHSGQGSQEYEILSIISSFYKPAPLGNKVYDIDANHVYELLVQAQKA
jgi:hypothetical protein